MEGGGWIYCISGYPANCPLVSPKAKFFFDLFHILFFFHRKIEGGGGNCPLIHN